jgi:phage-related protein
MESTPMKDSELGRHAARDERAGSDLWTRVQHLDQVTDLAAGVTVITCGDCHAQLREASYQAPAGHLDSCRWAVRGKDCDECGAFIPDSVDCLINRSHEESCSLFPGEATAS